MSGGYNDRLKPIAWKGECGDTEREEPRTKWNKKAVELVEWMKASKHTVAFTGAGISTSSGIPDFRGPKGVWTLEKKGKKPDVDIAFSDARPSFTHMALVALMQHGYLHYVVSQNVDNLHLRSGLPRDKLSELHGNIFAEHCDLCNTEYVRDFDLHGMGCRPTGRICETPGCGGALRDKTIDWDSPLPEQEFSRAIDAHKKADLCLCLGTSLRIRPAGNMPLRTLRKHNKPAPGRLVIVNLQKTHLDRSASMRFHVRTDQLMREVCRLLNVPVAHDDVQAAELEAKAQADAKAAASTAAAAAASSSIPKPVKVLHSGIGRPTRANTERLRPLYNPVRQVKEEEKYAAASSSSVIVAAAASSSSSSRPSAAPSSSSSSRDTIDINDDDADDTDMNSLLLRATSTSDAYPSAAAAASSSSSSSLKRSRNGTTKSVSSVHTSLESSSSSSHQSVDPVESKHQLRAKQMKREQQESIQAQHMWQDEEKDDEDEQNEDKDEDEQGDEDKA